MNTPSPSPVADPARTTPPLTLCELTDPGTPGWESHSPFCLKVHRALGVAALRYTRRHAERPDQHRGVNATGQVPVLLVGDEAVADSTAILHRINALSGDALLRGLDAKGRAAAWCWEELADTSLNGFVVASRWADSRNWEAVRQAYFGSAPAPVRAVLGAVLRRRVIAGLVARDVWRRGPEACWSRFERLVDALEAQAPTQGFWLGEHPGVADVSLFGQLHALRSPLSPWQRETLAARPRLWAWLDRVALASRPAEDR